MFKIDSHLTNSQKIAKLIQEADAIVVGIGSGLTNADGIGYSGARFESNFADFIAKFKFLDMLQASVFDFPSWPVYWAFHSRFIDLNFFSQPVGQSFLNLKQILNKKDYFIITTNSDNSLETADFDEDKVFYIQGKYNRMQCSKMCHSQTYQDDDLMRQMIQKQKNMEVPYELLPRCLKCDAFLEANKRFAGKGMVEDDNFFAQKSRYEAFLEKYKNKKVLFWEIGVGYITPQLIKWPFWQMVENNSNSYYLTTTNKNYRINKNILDRTLAINDDLKILMEQVKKEV